MSGRSLQLLLAVLVTAGLTLIVIDGMPGRDRVAGAAHQYETLPPALEQQAATLEVIARRLQRMEDRVQRLERQWQSGPDRQPLALISDQDPEQGLQELDESAATPAAGDAIVAGEDSAGSAMAVQRRIEQTGLTREEYEALEDRYQAIYLEDFEQQWLRRRERFLDSEALPDPRAQLRSELGDDGYDRYLYASGSPNRVRVRSVMQGSAASFAGLREGDVILSYGGERVFDFQDLRRASYRGEPGENVILEVRRADGGYEQVLMRRGPMGISSGRGAREVPP